MQRFAPGMPAEVLVVINAAPEPTPVTQRTQGKWRGRLQRLLQFNGQLRMARRLRGYAQLPTQYPFVSAVHFRGNQGQDFGAYDLGYQLLQREGYDGEVLFMNSSVAGPHRQGWLLEYRRQFRRHPDVGLCGIGLNSHDTSREPSPFAPHVQSYFLYTDMRVLRHALGERLFDRHERVDPERQDKLEIIQHGEIGVSARVLDAGYCITSPRFPEFAYRRGNRWSIPRGDLRYSARHPQLANTI
ncbi:MAG TPA: hypothetical protein VJU61_03840 [Polyangiaceae bacterium]|nr:hypothetical protein [Polyangiaceae bacterium]